MTRQDHRKTLSGGQRSMLTPEVFRRVASFGDYNDIDQYRACSRLACETASSDEVWLELLACAFWDESVDDLRSSIGRDAKGPANIGEEGSDATPLGFMVVSRPSSQLIRTCSWRVAFARFLSLARRLEKANNYRQFQGKLFIDIANAWYVLEQWLINNSPQESRQDIYNTLRGPADSEVLARIPARSLRYSYGLRDGQDIPWDEDQRSLYWGLFGGFSAYNVLIVTRFLHAGVTSSQFSDISEEAADQNYIFARSLIGGGRRFAVDANDYEVCILTGLNSELAVQPGPHAFARWFIEFTRRLSSGVYKLGYIVPDDDASFGIVLFPDEPDGDFCVEAITHGIAVRASALYCASNHNGFAYSIRLRMLPDNSPYASAQLESRTWTIVDIAANDTRRVHGQGVIGKFPVLTAGGFRDDYQFADLAMLPFRQAVRLGVQRQGTFVYQSFSGSMRDPQVGGTFEGVLTFVPNEILHPSGPKFSVRVPRFTLRRSNFIY